MNNAEVRLEKRQPNWQEGVERVDAEQAQAVAIDKRTMAFGLGLIVLGVLMPAIFPIKWLGVMPKLTRAMAEQNQGLLILTAGRVVLLNTVHALPQVLGAVVVADEILRVYAHLGRYLHLAVPVAIFAGIYGLIYAFYGFSYGWVATAVLIALSAGIARAMRKSQPHVIASTLMFTLVIFGAQWLKVMPALDVLGRGTEVNCAEIKRVAGFMQAGSVLNFIGFLFFGFTLILAVLLIRMMVVHNRELELERRDRKREEEMQQMKMTVLEAKTFKELRRLTHDLKTPLTVIQGLTSVLQLMLDQQGGQAAAICERINVAAENMNEMITDIVMQEKRQPLSVPELLTYTTAQVSPKQGDCDIVLQLEENLPKVSGNRVRLTRALANLLENALEAMGSSGGQVEVTAKSLPDHRVRITISDNGPGIPDEDKPKVFETGFSARGTPGLGLPFAHEVIRDHGGAIELWSVAGVGTKVVVFLPEVIEN